MDPFPCASAMPFSALPDWMGIPCGPAPIAASIGESICTTAPRLAACASESNIPIFSWRWNAFEVGSSSRTSSWACRTSLT